MDIAEVTERLEPSEGLITKLFFRHGISNNRLGGGRDNVIYFSFDVKTQLSIPEKQSFSTTVVADGVEESKRTVNASLGNLNTYKIETRERAYFVHWGAVQKIKDAYFEGNF